MTDPVRRPAAFAVPQPDETAEAGASQAKAEARNAKPRKPRAVRADVEVAVTPPEDDPFAGGLLEGVPIPARTPRRGMSLSGLFFGAAGLLASLAFGLWVDGLIRDLFSRNDWLGWAALALTVIAALALAGILARELLALRRLSSVERLQARAADAAVHPAPEPARAVVGELETILAARPETAAGRKAIAATRGEVIDGPDLIRLAETELLGPLDDEARKLVLDAAKRVSVVTAVSPRAVVDIGYVLFEAGRLIRAVSFVYGGRAGTIGFFRLARSVMAHLAVTGSMALGDNLAGQVLGHGLAARLSARLGEGVLNGLMTVRIGIAAIEAARPLPFIAVRRPGISDFAGALFKGSGTSTRDADDAA